MNYKLLFILFLSSLFCQNALSIDSQSKDFFFSSKIFNSKKADGTIIIFNQDAIIRTIDNGFFRYTKVPEGCYILTNDQNICIDNNSKIKTNSNINNLNTNSNIMINGEFFNQRDQDCNILKFQVAKNFIIQKQSISAIELQLFQNDLFDVLRLYIVEDSHKQNQNKNHKAFIINMYNEITCIKNAYYNIYDGSTDINKEEKDLIQYYEKSTERYNYALSLSTRNMLLPELKIVTNADKNTKGNLDLSDIIIHNNIVKKIDYKKLGVEFNDVYFQDLTWK